MLRIPLRKSAAEFWLIGQDAPSYLLTAVQVAISSLKPNVLAARVREVITCEVLAELERITVPILYIQAKQDRLVSASCVEEIRRIKPQVRVARLDGPHLLLQREPQKSAELVSEFLLGLDLSPMGRTGVVG
jgi:pimeloyl-ACP methyl ester carboxylesterase